MKVTIHNNGILTLKKLKILYWVALGKSNWEISKIEGLAEQTVANQVSSILKILNATNRAHAVTKAIAKGIISIHVLVLALFVNASDIDQRRGARRQSRRRAAMHTVYTSKIVSPYYIPEKWLS